MESNCKHRADNNSLSQRNPLTEESDSGPNLPRTSRNPKEGKYFGIVTQTSSRFGDEESKSKSSISISTSKATKTKKYKFGKLSFSALHFE